MAAAFSIEMTHRIFRRDRSISTHQSGPRCCCLRLRASTFERIAVLSSVEFSTARIPHISINKNLLASHEDAAAAAEESSYLHSFFEIATTAKEHFDCIMQRSGSGGNIGDGQLFKKLNKGLNPDAWLGKSHYNKLGRRYPSLRLMLRQCWPAYGKVTVALIALFVLVFFFLASQGPTRSSKESIETDLLSTISTLAAPRMVSMDRTMGASLAKWLREGKALGWCNSALGMETECKELPKCLVSPLVPDQSVNLWSQPYQVSSTQPGACEEPLKGQLPYKEGTQVQVSFILTITDPTSDFEAARLILESFLTAREADSVQYSVFRQEPIDDKVKAVSQ